MDATSERILVAIGELKSDLGGLKADVRHVIAQAAAIEPRVGTLEHARSRATGYILALSAVGGLVTTAGVAIAKAIL